MSVRRQLVHTQPVSRVKSVAQEFKGKAHRHFCSDRECRLFYEDNCERPEQNGLCHACRGLSRPYAQWMDPQECCLDNCEQVTDKSELSRYALAGPGPWYQCKKCARTHGWNCAT